jgi:hypothetical protein
MAVGYLETNCQRRTRQRPFSFYSLHTTVGNGAMNKEFVANGAEKFLQFFSVGHSAMKLGQY